MIKKVKLKYFESHQDTEVEFGQGLNLIIGPSNSGKSSLIRAISCCVANRWDKQQVRTGHTYCQAYVQTQKGWVQCQRGQGINKWRVFDGKQIKDYKSIGSGVPEQVPYILGMGQRNRGELKQLPNFMFQLQKHYMLSQIDGKKATSNLVARMMDNAIGLGGMQDLIKNIATDLGKDKRNLTQVTSQISQIKSSILDESIFNTYQNNIEDCKRLLSEIKELEKMYENSGNLQFNLTKTKNEIKKINQKKIELDICQIEKDYLSVIERISILEQFLQVNKSLQKFHYLKQFDVDEITNGFEQLRTIANKYAKSLQLNKMFKNKKLVLNGLAAKINNDKKLFLDKQQRMTKLKDELGFCPLCERQFQK